MMIKTKKVNSNKKTPAIKKIYLKIKSSAYKSYIEAAIKQEYNFRQENNIFAVKSLAGRIYCISRLFSFLSGRKGESIIVFSYLLFAFGVKNTFLDKIMPTGQCKWVILNEVCRAEL